MRRGIIQPIRRLVSGAPAASQAAGNEQKDAVKGKDGYEPVDGGQEKSSCDIKKAGGGGG